MPPRLHLRDKAEIGTFVEVTNGPEPVEEWQYSAAVSCRFVRTTTREVLDGKEQDLTDVQMTFRASEEISDSSRFKLTKANRSNLATVEYYEIVGSPWRTEDNRHIVCNCQSVPTGSE